MYIYNELRCLELSTETILFQKGKMGFTKILHNLVISYLATYTAALAVGGKPYQMVKSYKRAPLQDVVRILSGRFMVNLTVAGNMGRAFALRSRRTHHVLQR